MKAKTILTSGVIIILSVALLATLTDGYRDWSFGNSSSQEDSKTSLPGTSIPTTSNPGSSFEPIKPEPNINTYKIEAEECNLNVATSQNSMPWASKGYFVGGFSEGASISFEINSSEIAKAKFEIVLANTSKENISLSSLTNFLVINGVAYNFNETAVIFAPTEEEISTLNNQYPDQTFITSYGVFKTIFLEIDLVKDTNSFVLNGPGNFNFDYFNLETTANLIAVLNAPVEGKNWSAFN